MVNANFSDGRNQAKPNVFHQHQPTKPVRLLDREAGCDRAAQHVPCHHRGLGAGAVDQLTKPGEQAIGVERPQSRQPGGTVRREVGGDGPDASPTNRGITRIHLPANSPGAMQKDDRPPVTALKDGALDAGEGQPSLGGGNPGEQPVAGVAVRA